GQCQYLGCSGSPWRAACSPASIPDREITRRMRVSPPVRPREAGGPGGSFPRSGKGRSEAGERRLQRVEPERAEVERVSVELLEAERRALARLGLLAGLQPDPLADLVRRRLTRPAEVAVELEAEELVGHPAVRPHELPSELRRPPLPRVEAERVVSRDLQLQ